MKIKLRKNLSPEMIYAQPVQGSTIKKKCLVFRAFFGIHNPMMIKISRSVVETFAEILEAGIDGYCDNCVTGAEFCSDF